MTTRRSASKLARVLAVAIPVALWAGVGHAGAQTPDDRAIEQRLADLHYDVGAVDGTIDRDTGHAVTAFQKVHGMPRTGELNDEVKAAIMAASGPPAPLEPGGGANRVEIDLDKQVLYLYENDALTKILPVSTGNGERFCSGGYCRRAITPEGAFKIREQRTGWETSPLGRLYNSQYFHGGYAIHGSNSVPATPASHGCVRIPMSAAEWFPDHVSVGTPVYVTRGGEGTPPPPAATQAAAPPPAAQPPAAQTPAAQPPAAQPSGQPAPPPAAAAPTVGTPQQLPPIPSLLSNVMSLLSPPR